MIFIFDWGHKTKRVFGPLSQDDISMDIPSEFVNLVRSKSWFRAFFIPTIPTSTRYFLMASESNLKMEISKADFEKFKPLAELNALVVKNEITEEEYKQRRAKIKQH